MSWIPRAFARRRSAGATGALMAGLALALGAWQGAAEAAETTWKFAQTTPIPGTVWHRYATEVLPQRIEEATGGQVRVEVVSGVVPPADLLPGIRDGELQGGALLFTHVAPTIPLWNVMSLPGLVDDESHYPDVLNDHVFPLVTEQASERYAAVPVALGTFPGAYFFSNGPIDTIEKFAGNKYRAHSPQLVQIIQGAGGTAVSLPFGELYAALQRRMVNAYTSAVTAVAAAKLYEVTDYAENWPAGLGTFGYFLSEAALSDLSEEQQSAVMAAMAELNAEMQAATLAEVAVAIETLKAAGMTFVEVPESERERASALARDKAWPAWLETTGEQGQALVERIAATD